jgi:hypothetical protein
MWCAAKDGKCSTKIVCGWPRLCGACLVRASCYHHTLCWPTAVQAVLCRMCEWSLTHLSWMGDGRTNPARASPSATAGDKSRDENVTVLSAAGNATSSVLATPTSRSCPWAPPCRDTRGMVVQSKALWQFVRAHDNLQFQFSTNPCNCSTSCETRANAMADKSARGRRCSVARAERPPLQPREATPCCMCSETFVTTRSTLPREIPLQ